MFTKHCMCARNSHACGSLFLMCGAVWLLRGKPTGCLESLIGVCYLHVSCLLISLVLPKNLDCLPVFLIVVKYLSRFPLVPCAWKNMWAQDLSKQEQNKMPQVEENTCAHITICVGDKDHVVWQQILVWVLMKMQPWGLILTQNVQFFWV